MSDDLRECYRLLELDSGSSTESVKRSYRDLVKLWHPDRYSPGSPLQHKAEERLKEINLAYERILKKPRMAGGEDPPPKSAHAAPSMAEEPETRKRDWSAADRDDEPGAAAAPRNAEVPDDPATARAEADRAVPPLPKKTGAEGAATVKHSGRWHRWWIAAGAGAVLVAVIWGFWLFYPQPAAKPPPSPLAKSNSPSAPAAAAVPNDAPAPLAVPPPGISLSAAAPPARPDQFSAESPPRSALPEPFTLGSTQAEVIAAQGKPDRATATTFQYGSSIIRFQNGRVDSWRIGIPPLKMQAASPEVAARLGYYTTGSTKDEVVAVQGIPERFTATQFQYGSSVVVFRDNRVESWREGSAPLKARTFAGLPDLKLGYFAVGSSKAEVIAAQGHPDRATATTFQYGSSIITFDHERVVSWREGTPALRARLDPVLPNEGIGYFTVGSSKDDVVTVQGLPEHATADTFQYGTSTVFFRNDKVIAWQAGSAPLKAKVPPPVQP